MGRGKMSQFVMLVVWSFGVVAGTAWHIFLRNTAELEN